MKKLFLRRLTLKALLTPFFILAGLFCATSLFAGQFGDKPSVSVPFFSTKKAEWATGGVITLSSRDEPVIVIGSQETSGEIKVKLYKANKDFLFNYLRHTSENKQIQTRTDVSGMEQVAEFTETVTASYSDGKRISLPLEDSGIWYITNTGNGLFNDAVIVRSGFGGVVKNMGDRFLFWTQDFASMRSLDQVSVTVFDMTDAGTQLGSGGTNNEGIVQLPFSSKADVAFLEKDGQVALLPINMEYFNSGYSYTRFRQIGDEFLYYLFTDRPIYKSGDTINFKALIRQDDDARYSIPTGTARVTLRRGWSEEDTIFEKILPISVDGSVIGEYVLPESATTGDYRLQISMSQGGEQGSWSEDDTAYLKVEEYRKPEYFLELSTQKDKVYLGEQNSVTVQGSYFSGQPLAGGQVTYTITSEQWYQPTTLDSLKYYTDDQYGYYYSYGQEVSKGSTGLDTAGRAEIALPLDIDISDGKVKIYSVGVEFMDQTGNPVQARKNILVYPGEVALYRDDDGWSPATEGERYNLPVVVVPNKEGAKVSSLAVTAKGSLKRYEKTGEGANVRYEPREESVSDIVAVTNKDGKATLTFTPQKTGYYTFETSVADSTGRQVSNTFNVYVYSKDRTWNGYTSPSSSLQLSTDKDSYNPGETAKVTISSDDADKDILLVNQRARVDRFQVVRMNGKTATVNYKIEDVDMPNTSLIGYAFGNRTLQSSSKELTVSAEKKRINVTLTTDKKIYGPGEMVNLTVKTADYQGKPTQAEVAVWTVDKALFELSTDTRRNIFKAFWDTRYSYSAVGHSLEHINIDMAEGGGGCFVAGTKVLMADGSFKNIEKVKAGDTVKTRVSETDTSLVNAKVTDTHEIEEAGYLIINKTLKVTPSHILWVNDTWKTASEIQVDDVLVNSSGEQIYVESVEWFNQKVAVYNLTVEKYHTYFADGFWVHNQKGDVRSVLKDAAYWNPTVRTDKTGTATVSFKLPDNLTTWAISAVASTTASDVGEVKTEVITQKPVVVRPVLPNVLRVGDKLSISTLLHNFTDSDKNFDVSLNYPGVEIIGQNYTGITVAGQGGIQQLFWQITPTEVNPEAKVTFSAKATEGDFGDAIEQALPIIPFGFTQESSFAGLNTTEYQLNIPNDADEAHSTVELSLSPTMLGTLPSAMKFLIQYPYGCVEQTTSRFVPAVIAWTNKALFAEAFEGTEIEEIMQKGVNRLQMLQNQDGGWGWTNNGWSSDPFITAYVTEYLVRAKAAGVLVPEDMLNSTRYFAEGTSSDLETVILKHYALMQLDEKEKLQVPVDKTLTSDVLAFAIMANLNAGITDPAVNGVNLLTERIETSGELASVPAGKSHWFGSRDASTALALRALTKANADKSLTTPLARYLMEKRTKHYWSNTFATAQVVQAIVDFTKASGDTTPTYTYKVFLDDQQLEAGAVTGTTQFIKPISIPVAQAKTGKVRVEKDGEGSLYSSLQVTAFRTDPNTKAEARGMKITRDYTAGKGRAYYPSVGDTVTISLKVENIPSGTDYLVIEDQLPSGMIPINQNLNNEATMSDYYYGGYWYGMDDTQVKKDGAVFLLPNVGDTARTLTYEARVIAPGEFRVPPASVADMYNADLGGYTDAVTIKVTGEPERDPSKAVKVFVEDFWSSLKAWWSSIVRWITTHQRQLIGGIVLLTGLWYIVRTHKKRVAKLAAEREQDPPITPDSISV